jgi:hypothetical protein
MTAIARSEGRTRAARGKPRRRQLKRDLIRLDIGAANLPASSGVLHDDMVHGVATDVVVATQIGARA